MPLEWQHRRWGDLATLEYGKGLRGYELARGLYRVFGTNGPIGRNSEPLCQHPTVIVGRKGAYRGIHFSPAPCWVIDTAFYLKPKAPLEMRWAYYQLLTQDINGMDSGSAIPSTSRDEFYQLEVDVPPLAEQRAIAQILGALDDKIELNRRMNETLEAIARAIFKSWFVDFDPVRAKAEGRDPGLPPDLAALFPDSFEDSELGEVPKGWEVGRLSDLVTNVVDRVRPGPETERIPYVPIQCISPRTVCLNDWQPGGNARSSLVRFEPGDILFGAMRPYFHKVCIAAFSGTTRTTAWVLRPRPDEFGFSLFVVSRDETIDYATAHSEGSTIPYAKWANSMESLPLVLPTYDLANAFHQLVQPMLSLMHGTVTESRLLATIRDALLPKLLSGEVRVPPEADPREAHHAKAFEQP